MNNFVIKLRLYVSRECNTNNCFFYSFQIQYDFDELFPGKEFLLLTKWNNFFETIVNLKEKQLSGGSKDIAAVEILTQLKGKEELSEGKCIH